MPEPAPDPARGARGSTPLARKTVLDASCSGSQAEGKRYHDWDGCIERITQLDAWPDFHRGHQPESGSLTGRLYVRNARDSARILCAAAKIFMCQERTLRRGTKALAVGAARW
jgi:hypothetical protein